ncbi:hypothetical protein CDAR_495681 [Caerostris darwini]|uniref:Uncharacterized protein n=1 Tax=Caerostris darwini TaxID=1538125 RepID=A0AAV4T3Z8_9ARAC|nr:hypothetical protein CDAR_495681 [Caerostris darwini]
MPDIKPVSREDNKTCQTCFLSELCSLLTQQNKTTDGFQVSNYQEILILVLCIAICDTAYIVTEKTTATSFQQRRARKENYRCKDSGHSVTAARVSVMDSVTATQARLLVWAPEIAD